MQVHHIIPFHLCSLADRKDLELDERVLMTLCDETVNSHHLLLGHLKDWKSYNLDVRQDAPGQFYNMAKQDILKNLAWLELEKKRPNISIPLTDAEKAELQQLMDQLYGPPLNLGVS